MAYDAWLMVYVVYRVQYEKETEPDLSLATEMRATNLGVWSSRYGRPLRFGTE